MSAALPARKLYTTLTLLGVLICDVMFTCSSLAESFPERRITFVVPYPAGGGTDVVARVLASKLQESWKRTVVVENKSGGGGVVGADFVAKAPADGYTVLVGITQLTQAPNLGTRLPYDLFKDFAPVTQAAIVPIAFVVPQQQPEKSLKDFVTAAKADPGKLAYGSYGNATTAHLYGELLKKSTGIDMTHVPYRGSAPLTSGLIGGQINAAFVDLGTAAPQLSAGKMRALAVVGEARNSLVPEIPSLAELGYSGFEAQGWVGVFVPAGTSKDIVKKLDDELSRIIKSPDGSEKLRAANLVPVGEGADAFAAMLRKDLERWGNVARTAGVKAE